MRARKFHYMVVYKYLTTNRTTGNGSSHLTLPKQICSKMDVECIRGYLLKDNDFNNVIITDYKLVRESRG